MGSPEHLGATAPTADVFCKIVDNFGDAGIAWRLARGLARDHGFKVRFFIDDLAPLARLKPALNLRLTEQTLEGVSIVVAANARPLIDPADFVIEVLAAEVPKDYLQAMATRTPKPVWVLYEYLSAEPWVEKTHLMPSPHPTLPLTRYFFYPGFSDATGGLLGDPSIVIPPPARQINSILLFGYDNKPVLKEFIACLQSNSTPVKLDVPAGPCLKTIETFTGTNLSEKLSLQIGNLTITAIPFVEQDVLIRNLARYGLNIVRGEDSLTLAILTGRPVIWHIYPQEGDVHLDKLGAFLDRYTASLSPPAAEAVRNMNLSWNGRGDVTQAWKSYLVHFIEISKNSRRFAATLHAQGDALQKLVDFFRRKG